MDGSSRPAFPSCSSTSQTTKTVCRKSCRLSDRRCRKLRYRRQQLRHRPNTGRLSTCSSTRPLLGRRGRVDLSARAGGADMELREACTVGGVASGPPQPWLHAIELAGKDTRPATAMAISLNARSRRIVHLKRIETVASLKALLTNV